jgi:hypothetical protein
MRALCRLSARGRAEWQRAAGKGGGKWGEASEEASGGRSGVPMSVSHCVCVCVCVWVMRWYAMLDSTGWADGQCTAGLPSDTHKIAPMVGLCHPELRSMEVGVTS